MLSVFDNLNFIPECVPLLLVPNIFINFVFYHLTYIFLQFQLHLLFIIIRVSVSRCLNLGLLNFKLILLGELDRHCKRYWVSIRSQTKEKLFLVKLFFAPTCGILYPVRSFLSLNNLFNFIRFTNFYNYIRLNYFINTLLFALNHSLVFKFQNQRAQQIKYVDSVNHY